MWFQGHPSYAGGPFSAYNGPENAYIACGVNSILGVPGTISNWLVTPNRTLRNGDVFTFFTRKNDVGQDFPDRLEVRMSTNGTSINVGTIAEDVGDFTNLLLSINPTLVVGGYPTQWTQYTITISGLAVPTSGRLAFRYFVTNAGPNGSNSDYIGIDNVIYTPNNCPDIAANYSQVNLNCNGGDNGGIFVTPLEDSAYTYVWSHDPNNTTNVATNLSAGYYSCTISNECGTSIVRNFTITEPTMIQVNLVKDISDENPTENTITVNPTGGYPGYSYEWSNGSTSASVSNLPSGNHWVKVTDGNFCEVTENFEIPTDCPDIFATSSQVGISCYGGADGSASVIASGDSGFTYVWSHDPSNTTNVANNLSAGSYSCTITNDCGVSMVVNIMITQPPLIQVNLVKDISGENPTENTITTNPTGGNPGYSYEWSNGSTSASVSNLPLGGHWVKVTDVNLCQVTEYFYITDWQLQIIHEDTINLCPDGTIVLSPLVLPELETGDTNNDFTGVFAPENWQQSSDNSDGSINFNGSTGLTFVSGNNDSNDAGYNRISTTVQYHTEISFNWNYSTGDSPDYDYPQILIDNATFNLSGYDMGGSNIQSGTYTISVPAGSTFSIQMVTFDNTFGAATMVLSNFTYAESVNGVYTYLWTNEDNQVVGNLPTYEAAEPGIYTLTVTDPSGNSFSKSIEVIWQVVEAPQVDFVHFFVDGDTVADIPVQGQNLVWQNQMGDVIPETTPLQDFAGYMVTQTIDGCTSLPAPVTAINDNMVTWTGTEWINGLPSENVNVRVMGDLKVGTDVTDFSAAILFISSEGSITISDGRTVTISGVYINESNLGAAGFVVESGGNLLQIDDFTNNALMGDITIIRDSNPMKRLDYTLWSSPIKEQNLFGFSPETVNGVTNYPGSTGRIYVYDGFANAYVNPNPFTATTVMNIGVGYLFRAPNNYHATDEVIYKGVFTGIPNNGYMNIPAFVGSYTSAGNPYPSNIDANLFLAGNPGASALYFWNNTDVAGNNYATYTTAGGTAAGGGSEEPDGIITVGQGFIVESTGPILNFNNWMRVGVPGTFFKANETERHRFWLDLTNVDTERINQILISYMDGATNGIDNQIDGKQFGNETSALYSLINDEKFAIQGRALPFEDSDVIPLGFKAVESGQFNISLNNFDGLFTEGNLNIFLNDKQLNIAHNLMESAYTFESEIGEFNERFEIIYGTDGTMGIEDLNANAIQIYTQDQNIFVSSKQQKILSVELYDLSGKNIHSNHQVNANLYEIKSNTKGVLVVKVQTQNGEIVTKKVISK